MHLLRTTAFNRTLGILPIRDYPFITSPSDNVAYRNEINASVQALESQVFRLRTTLPADFVRDWYAFSGEWTLWTETAGEGWWDLMSGQRFVEMRRYANRYNAFERRFEQITGREGGTPDVLTPEEEETGLDEPTGVPIFLWITLGVAGVFGLGYLAWAVVRGLQTTGVQFSGLDRRRRKK